MFRLERVENFFYKIVNVGNFDIFLNTEIKIIVVQSLSNINYNYARQNDPIGETPFQILKELRNHIRLLTDRIVQLESRFDQPYENDYSDGYVNFMKEIEIIKDKLTALENKFEERVPHRVVSEDMFKEETEVTEELIDKIVSRIADVLKKPSILSTDDSLTLVESKRIEKIIHLLERHEKLNSNELSEILGLSRTRSNEYFKIMERMNLIVAKLEGKEKYYLLKGLV